MLEYMKAKSEEERKEFDSNNLNLQSLLYGKHYFSGEVHFCKEFKTPNLQNALPEEEYASRFKNLSPNVPEEARRANFEFLGQQLRERQELTNQLHLAEQEKKEKEDEFKRKQRILEDLPYILTKLEEDSVPMQDYFNNPRASDSDTIMKQ
jgi:uncharacterized membrane protein YfhO